MTRVSLPGGTAIRKEPLGPDPGWRLRHEVAVLERLRGVDGVAQLLDLPCSAGSIMLADAGDTTLAGLASPLAVDELIRVAVKLAEAVAGMHGREVLHRDITPANIVISGDGAPCLVDFALATSFAEAGPGFIHHSKIVGSLPYLAPEQTGRTGRAVDRRADLYALGATLYELATGAPPFGTGDPLRLTHDHLARVPVPPTELNPAVPAPLSEIVMHLLEKEPDHRYQSAEGLAHDLEQVRDATADPATARMRVGEHDVPPRLLPPARPVGRERELAALEAAFEEALAGRCRGVLVSGPPGVGKTVLVDQLRPVVTGRAGWFVTGKFDQYRRDLGFSTGDQAFRALGRLLLAEPEDELGEVRARILAAVGSNAGLLSAVIPEFAALLGVPPDAGDPLTAQARAQRAAVQVLRAVASRKRPVVLFLDDLQGAGRTPLGFVDLLLAEEPVEGLVLVAAYREPDVDAADPLPGLPSRWHDQSALRLLRLDNLAVPAVVTMVAQMLRVDRAAATGLVKVINERTCGNPYETVELLNTLRHDGMLTAGAAGWQWDEAAAHAHLGRSDIAALLAARVDAMPAPSRAVVEAIACLGGQAEIGLLRTATAASANVVGQRLTPALDAGLLMVEQGPREQVRFRNDRIREVILDGLDARRLRGMHLAMARRLSGAPELFTVAAEQYLPVIDALTDADERDLVAGLLRRAADRAALVGDHAQVNALLVAALRLTDPGQASTLVELHTARHAALFSLGRLEEADREYRAIERLGTTALDSADARALQVRALTHRNRYAEAIHLGLDSLRELGLGIPAVDELRPDLDRQFTYLYRWLERTETAQDLARPEITDPKLLAAARLITAILPAAYHAADLASYGWLSLEAMRIWLEHGPATILLGPAGTAAFAAVVLRSDDAAGYRAARRVLMLAEASGREPDTAQVRHRFSLTACWFEPIEDVVRAAQQARDGLIAGGDLALAGHTYGPTGYYLLDCAPTLDAYAEDVEAGLAFARRTGNEQAVQWLESYQWLARVLRGEQSASAGSEIRYADNPQALLHAHFNRTTAAAVLGSPADLERHTAAVMPLLPAAHGVYPIAVARLLRGLALAARVRAGDGADRDGPLSELDEVMRWLAARAEDAPENFLHLLRLLEAERAWAEGDFRAAVGAFDAARREAARRRRPWHRALIVERAARFHLGHGDQQTGYELLAQARQQYAAWGATAKVDHLDWAYPTLGPPADATDRPADLLPRPGTVTTGTLDLLGILSASQVLSSETTIERLHSRVVEVLSAMTGATSVKLLLRSEIHQEWQLPTPGSDSGTTPISDTGHEGSVPLSVLRYVRRTVEPLVVDDATADDRFARDPYFTTVERCSLLALPVRSRGSLRAVLLLENRLIRGAFTTDRLDAVKLIAGQLAVSLDNAQLYAELTTSRARIVATADQTRRRIERDLHDGAQQRLVFLAIQAQTAKAAAPPEATELAAQLDQLTTEATSALDELRELARGIHPAMLNEAGLRPALKSLARRSTVPVTLHIRTHTRPPEHIEITAYYIVAEALTNTTKHSNSTHITVTIETDTTTALLRVRVRDNGQGGANLTNGSGLVGLKDRAEAVGGRLWVHTTPHQGTTVHAELPLDPTPDVL